MQIPRLTIWQQWLLHAFLIWAGSEVSDSISYWYEVNTSGPYLLNSDGSAVTQWQRFVNHNYYQMVWLPVLAGTLLIELNYHFIFRRRPLIHFLAGNILFSVVLVSALAFYNHWKSGGEIHSVLMPSAVLAGYGFAYALFRDFVHQRTLQAKQKIKQVEAELSTLKAQINPHFFFNTLNLLYGTALAENADRTVQCIEQLSNIMRYSISDAQRDFSTASQEFSFVQDYLDLQRMRLPERKTIQVETDLFHDGVSAQIAPFLLVPFIENAFKYGIRVDQDSFIKLKLTIRERVLDLMIENSIFSSPAGQAGLGTGIENTRRRLSIMYPEKHQLTLREAAGIYTVRLKILLY